MDRINKKIDELTRERDAFVSQNAPLALQASEILKQYMARLAGLERAIEELKSLAQEEGDIPKVKK